PFIGCDVGIVLNVVSQFVQPSLGFLLGAAVRLVLLDALVLPRLRIAPIPELEDDEPGFFAALTEAAAHELTTLHLAASVPSSGSGCSGRTERTGLPRGGAGRTSCCGRCRRMRGTHLG